EPFEKQYQNFAEGQPDGSGGFLQIFSFTDSSTSLYVLGKWDDTNTNGTNSGRITEHGFICEWDNQPEQVKAAPLASSFAQWLADPELRADGDGAAPSPVDRSHLRNNPPRITASSVFAAADENLPVSYDARKAIGLPEVRDQRKYNTCWAFAAIGALEASYRQQDMTALGEDPDLSELHLAYFTYRTIFSQDISAEYSILNQQGNPEKAAGFLSAQTAPVKEADMPYTVASDSDSEIEAFAVGKTFTRAPVILRETKIFGQIGSENMFLIKKAIIENGAVYFHYFHDDSGYNEASHSLYYTGLKGRHAALLVGWDDEFPADSFREQPSVNGAWLVRNSWGKDFGDDGYFWVSYEQGINAVMDECCVFVASEDVSDKTTEEKKNDNGGGIQSITPQWSGNIFRAERNENIVSISFQTTDNNAEYRIFINNLGKYKPSDPGSAATEPVLSGNMAYAGYHTLNLPNPLEVYSGDYYSVIVRMKTSYEYPTAAEGSIEGYFTASVTEGQSYFASGDEVPSVWIDGTNRDSLSGKEYNATVRVLTVERVSVETAPVIVTESLPAGKTGEPYTAMLEARGTGSIEWRSGRLPEGFAFSREGVLSGKSSAAVDEEVRFTAINNAGSDEAVLRLVVEAKKVVPDEPVVPVDPQSGDVFPDEPVLPDEPVVPESQDKRSVGSSSGGCSSGMWGVLGLAAMVFAGKRR
ncbi:MAG: hypothetical protein IJS39_08930, partial [Synergistaceae bacterium]|nr:hypothetical protein [Synergistaceae bacterium]